MPRIRPSLAILATTLLTAAVPAWAGQTTLVLDDREIDLRSASARTAETRTAADGGAPRALAAPANAPGGVPLVVPFVVDAGNPLGTTTLLSIRNEDSVDVGVEVRFYDSLFQQFHEAGLVLAPHAIQSFNLRDQPGLPPGLSRGFVRITPSGGDISADYFEVTPDQGFATGERAISFEDESCFYWQARVLVGGPFTGGTRLRLIIDGPRGDDPGDLPTVIGTAYDESGVPVNGFEVYTDQWVLELDVADLIAQPSLFGSVDLAISGLNGGVASGGHVTVVIGAEDQYSVGFPAVCLGNAMAAREAPAALGTAAVSTGYGEATVVLTEPRIDPRAESARTAAGRADRDAGTPGSIAAAANRPSEETLIVPFVADGGNPFGTTTLLSIRNEDTGDVGVEVRFYDSLFQQFHEAAFVLPPGAIQSFNLRDQPGLPPGLSSGLVRISPFGGEISADYFEVTPAEGFATGERAIAFEAEGCTHWQARVLVGGPFTGGTRLRLLIDGPLGGDPNVHAPTILGNAHDEAGALVGSFEVYTDQWVLELDVADLVPEGSLFGSLEMVINSEGGGHVTVEIGAEGIYSVGFPGVCRFDANES